ncbi:unnamed protein product [Nyctereutes procyonoides]|uniref:non-specific serine/threonine protein kinase n=1 Tax=Nyctereutes procyonoides TaxID=34880 RepID=A0A811YRE1_NYCPR|nr:unnamed protein product [Nyctereutes procyonoides]
MLTRKSSQASFSGCCSAVKKDKVRQPGWLSGLVPPSAQGVILGTWDQVLCRAPCMEPASPACVSASLSRCVTNNFKICRGTWVAQRSAFGAGGDAGLEGLVHLDVKPANIFLGPWGRCKLGDFGLLVELGTSGAGEAQEGDPHYMAPELLQGSYGTAADVFSLGLTVLEAACNIELPHGGEGWQQLRQGYLPPEFTAGLSSKLRSVLTMMLEPDPKLQATAEALLALPTLRHRGWALWQALLSLLCWLWHGLAHPASWLLPLSPPATPPGSPPCILLLDSSLSSSWDDDSMGLSLSAEAVLARATGNTSTPRSGSPAPQNRYTLRDVLDLSDIDSEPPRGSFPSFEPRNLLSLFEDSLGPG